MGHAGRNPRGHRAGRCRRNLPSIETADYVSILAVTADGRIPLVRQFRPALGRFTLEFPGGMRDGDEAPDACAIRELAEETGLQVPHAEPLAQFHPDSDGATACGLFRPRRRSDSRLASGKRGRAMMVGIDELYALALDGTFDHGPHLAMLGMATIKGLLRPSSI